MAVEIVQKEISGAHKEYERLAQDAEAGVQRGRLEKIDDPLQLSGMFALYEATVGVHPDKPTDVETGRVHVREADLVTSTVREQIDPTAQRALAGDTGEYEAAMQQFSQEAQADVVKNTDKKSLMARLREARWAKSVYMAAMLFRAASAMDRADPIHNYLGGEPDQTHHVATM